MEVTFYCKKIYFQLILKISDFSNPHQEINHTMVTSSESASDPPRQKFPKIMTESCYGALNNTNDMLWNNYEQDLIDDEDGSHQIASSLLTTTATTDSSIIDGISSINSSFYEQIPSMTSSIETTIARQRKIVKWWDDHQQQSLTEESLQDLTETAEEGEFVEYFSFLLNGSC